jgi:hypothetical protein
MTLSEIDNVDKQLLATRYDANSLSEDYFQIADLNLEETLAAMVKHRYAKQQLVNGSWV